MTTTAVIGTGVIGSAIARALASGGETLRLSSADSASARTLAAKNLQLQPVDPVAHSAATDPRSSISIVRCMFAVVQA